MTVTASLPHHGTTSYRADMVLLLLLFFIFTFSFNFACAQRSPSISFISKEKVVNIGDVLELKCQVQDAERYPVAWIKLATPGRDELFISRGQSIMLPEPRYAIYYDDQQLIYTLVVNKVQEIDAGMYRCQIITSINTKYKADVPVLVRIPPVISDNSTRSVITNVGARVTLQCYGSGFPPPVISWRREKHLLLPNNMAYYKGNNLTIERVAKEDRGTYYCVADNGVGHGARRHIGVEVEFPPYVQPGRNQVEQALQYDADLYCHIEAFPSPSIMWLKDGQVINDNQHYRISIFARTDEFMDSTLRVRRIEKKQYGNYVCQASNKLGTNQTTIRLSESVNIVCPPACDVSFYTSAAIEYRLHFGSSLMLLVLAVVVQITT